MGTSEVSFKGLSILYVEDEPEPREIIATALAAEYPELTIYSAEGGEVGLALFREHRPEVVITDIMMPAMDGLSMAREIAAIDSNTELIALTAYSDTSFLLSAIEIGFSHYVLKPIDYDRLFEVVAKSLSVLKLKRLVQEQNEQLGRFATDLEQKVDERTRELGESREELERKNLKLRELTRKLKATRDRYWSLYNWSPLGYLSLDDHYVVREVNITGAHMLGARRAELRDRSIEQFLSTENMAVLARAFLQCTQASQAQAELELTLEDMKVLYVHLHCLPYREHDEDRRLYRTAIVDITRLKEAEDKVRSSERLLIHQNRMAAMGEVLGNISHHWRQPLNVLGLQIQQLAFLNQEGDLDAQVLDAAIAKSMDILQHLSKTIDDFRDFSIPDENKGVFEIDRAIAKAVSLIKESFDYQGITVEVEARDGSKIDGYPNEFVQVLLNILMNAKDVFLERGTESPRITVASWSEDGKSIVTVTDNAGGINEEVIDKIFEPYFSTKETGKGTGLGLFMSKTIIEKNLGGRLTVHNSGAGAEFRIDL